MRVIGDVHGKIDQYIPLLDEEPSFQVGDMGLGFRGVHLPNLPKRHRFIRGNHDDPKKCQAHKNYAGEFGYWPEYRLFFMGGAFSIDYLMRIPGVSWWPDEQLSAKQFEQAGMLFIKERPEIVITHDCPSVVSYYLLEKIVPNFRPEKKVLTSTGQMLQTMWDLHQPKTWIFGHYHTNQQFDLHSTHFICLDELASIQI